MEIALQIIICLFLVFLAYQDFRYRAISWWLIPVLFGMLAYTNIQRASLEIVLENLMLNFGFIAIQLGALYIYFSIKNRCFVNIINTYLGSGDVLFFVVLAVSFSFLNYIVFQVVSFLLVAIGFGIVKMIKRNSSPEIPLAGGMSLVLILSFIIGEIKTISFYDDLFLLNLIG